MLKSIILLLIGATIGVASTNISTVAAYRDKITESLQSSTQPTSGKTPLKQEKEYVGLDIDFLSSDVGKVELKLTPRPPTFTGGTRTFRISFKSRYMSGDTEIGHQTVTIRSGETKTITFTFPQSLTLLQNLSANAPPSNR